MYKKKEVLDIIEVNKIHKHFGPVVAVEEVSFRALNALITGLLGANGAGKTTTLRILYTLLKPDRGTAHVDGYDVVKDIRHVQRSIGALRGISPSLVSPLAIEELDLSTPQSQAANLLNMAPYFIILAVFIGGHLSGHAHSNIWATTAH